MTPPGDPAPPLAGTGRPPGAEVLVSGAGFAGLAAAWWLHRLGHRVTVVEAAPALRRGGTPVDIEGETIAVLARMGLIDAVRARALPPRAFTFVGEDGRAVATARSHDGAAGGPDEKHEIHRDDLLEILSGAVGNSVEMEFGRTVTALEDGPDDVAVTFDDGARRRYALVLGCDGARSRVRRLRFRGGADAGAHFMGGYFFIKVVPETGLLPADTSELYSAPGLAALLNGYRDRTDIALAFRAEREIAYDHRDRASVRRMIRERFGGLGWKVPAMLDRLGEEDDFYFDRLSQVRMPAWSAGRVALVGDAGYCVSPMAGMGGSMAIIGAGRLADALGRSGADHAAAFRDYEAGLRPFVGEVQARAIGTGMAAMLPGDAAAIAARDRALREGGIAL